MKKSTGNFLRQVSGQEYYIPNQKRDKNYMQRIWFDVKKIHFYKKNSGRSDTSDEKTRHGRQSDVGVGI